MRNIFLEKSFIELCRETITRPVIKKLKTEHIPELIVQSFIRFVCIVYQVIKIY